MITLTVLGEGPTEVNFVTQVLKPHLAARSIFAKATSLGGGLAWGKLKRELDLSLRQRREHEFLTTMFDLYKLMRVPDCPDSSGVYGAAKAVLLETAMLSGLPNPNFVPYVQVHEFEALLFADLKKLSVAFPDGEADNAISVLARETKSLQPEDIDEGEQTAPSKRLVRELPQYKGLKSTAGPQIAENIGLPVLREACPHFNDWITKLENLSSHSAP